MVNLPRGLGPAALPSRSPHISASRLHTHGGTYIPAPGEGRSRPGTGRAPRGRANRAVCGHAASLQMANVSHDSMAMCQRLGNMSYVADMWPRNRFLGVPYVSPSIHNTHTHTGHTHTGKDATYLQIGMHIQASHRFGTYPHTGSPVPYPPPCKRRMPPCRPVGSSPASTPAQLPSSASESLERLPVSRHVESSPLEVSGEPVGYAVVREETLVSRFPPQ